MNEQNQDKKEIPTHTGLSEEQLEMKKKVDRDILPINPNPSSEPEKNTFYIFLGALFGLEWYAVIPFTLGTFLYFFYFLGSKIFRYDRKSLREFLGFF